MYMVLHTFRVIIKDEWKKFGQSSHYPYLNVLNKKESDWFRELDKKKLFLSSSEVLQSMKSTVFQE